MSKTTNTMVVHYSIETEILITSTPQGRPACMSHKVYTAHKGSQASWSVLWTDIPSGIHRTIKFVSLVMQKGQWSCQNDVSWKRLLLPQWLTQPLLLTLTRPQGKAAVRVLIALAQEHVSETLSCRASARQVFVCVQLLWSIYSACFQKCAWGLFLG